MPSGRYAVAPFEVDDRAGCIVALVAGDEFGERELRLLGGLAHQAKLAIANASSYEGLERTFVSTVEALANALEANDEYTSTHARWITDLSLRVGRELGLGERALKRLELGALLHDIGKIGIPSDILSKPGRLTAVGADDRPDASGARRADHRADRPPAGRAADRPPLPRALGRARLSGRRCRRGDPARVADHLRLRRVPRDDDRPAVPAGGSATARRCAGSRRARAASSTRTSSTSRSACSTSSARAGAARRSALLILAGRGQLRLAAVERVREAAERAVLRQQLSLAAALR